jgi:hypothetical protein
LLQERLKSYETVEDACSIAADVLAGSVDPNTGCALIASIAAKLNYPPDLEPFAAIAHDQEGHEAFGITAESCINDIVHACGCLIAGQARWDIGETMDWEPISEAELWEKILAAESRMSPQISRPWEAIKIPPEKWTEETYGAAGGGFWVVAVIGTRAIWYNDIEDGFDCSSYIVAGKLSEYFCNQYELEMAVQKVLPIVETGTDSAARGFPQTPGHGRRDDSGL